jgi:hypothetical protein
MLLTTISLFPPLGFATELAPGAIVDLLWLHAAPPDGVKHIHARAGPHRIDVAVFTVASEQSISDYIVTRVCERAVASIPALQGWRIAPRWGTSP